MRIPPGWWLVLLLVASPAQAEWRIEASAAGGVLVGERRVAPGAEAAAGVALGSPGWQGVLRAAGIFGAGRELSAMLAGPELLLRHRFGDAQEQGPRAWVGLGAGALVGTATITDMVMSGFFPRGSIEGGVGLPLAGNRWLDLGVALRWYTAGSFGSASLVLGSGW